jgi:hypothetical protein
MIRQQAGFKKLNAVHLRGLGRWLPLLGSNQAARDQSPVPYQLGERGNIVVPRAGFARRVGVSC